MDDAVVTAMLRAEIHEVCSVRPVEVVVGEGGSRDEWKYSGLYVSSQNLPPTYPETLNGPDVTISSFGGSGFQVFQPAGVIDWKTCFGMIGLYAIV